MGFTGWVKNGRIHAFPLDFQSWIRQIPDDIGADLDSHKNTPDLFSDISMAEEIRYFYSGFLQPQRQ
jgi:hypothetical protein